MTNGRKRRNSLPARLSVAGGKARTRARTHSLPLPRRRKLRGTVKREALSGKLDPGLAGKINGPIFTIDSVTEYHSSFFMRIDDRAAMLITNLAKNDRETRNELRDDIRQIKEDTEHKTFPQIIVVHTDDTPEAKGRARELIGQLLQEAGGRQLERGAPEETQSDGGKVSMLFHVSADTPSTVADDREGANVEGGTSAEAPTLQNSASAANNKRRLTEVLGNLTEGQIFRDEQDLKRQAADNLDTFIRINDGYFLLSKNFKDALDHLAQISAEDGLFGHVMDDIVRLKENQPMDKADLEALRTFVEYQVFRTGDHLKTNDEDSWTNAIADLIIAEHQNLSQRLLSRKVAAAIAAEVLKEARDKQNEIDNALADERGGARQQLHEAIYALITDPSEEIDPQIRQWGIAKEMVTKAINGRIKDMIKAQVAKNYMCRCFYSEPSPTLIRRDMPRFVWDRLRVQDRNVSVHIFETKNGYSVAYDPRRLGLDPAKRYTIEQIAGVSQKVEEFLNAYQQPDESVKGQMFELVPFDSQDFMIADVRVPVMADGVSIRFQPDGLSSFDLKIGKSPAELGIKMTREPAGVFKRSLNSQRVIEIADWNDQGEKVVFQLKGSGVPAYGFMSDPDWSGGEYLALTIEKGAMIFRHFVRDLFGHTDVVPEMVGVAMIADPKVATNEEAAGRFGAVSFRIDRALGIRLSNITYESVAAEMGHREEVRSVTHADDWQLLMAGKLARNMALANIFGLQYNDSGVTKLVDIGLHGEFADTGGLWNLDRPPKVTELALVAGISQRLGQDAVQEFKNQYVIAMLNALETIGNAAGTQFAEPIATLRSEFIILEGRIEKISAGDDKKWKKRQLIELLQEIQLSMLSNLAHAMGGSDQGPTIGQLAYAAGGIGQFAEVLVSRLTQVRHTWMREAIQQLAQDGRLEDAILSLDIKSEANLRQIMNLRPEDPWPETTGSYSFKDRLNEIKRKHTDFR